MISIPEVRTDKQDRIVGDAVSFFWISWFVFFKCAVSCYINNTFLSLPSSVSQKPPLSPACEGLNLLS